MLAWETGHPSHNIGFIAGAAEVKAANLKSVLMAEKIVWGTIWSVW